MISCGEQRLSGGLNPQPKSDNQQSQEINRLNAAIDILTSKMVEKEVALREAAAGSSRTIIALEQRAKHAEDKLRLIEQSFGWRILRSSTSKLDKHPKLKLFLKRSIMAVRWTVRGQILSKIKQFRQARYYEATMASLSHPTADDFEKFWVYPSVLPRDLLDQMLSFTAENGPARLLMAVNFYAGGGAESAALEYAISFALKNKGSSVFFIMTDIGPRKPVPRLPQNILVLDLTAIEDTVNSEIRENFLFLIMRSIPLETIHIVNSIVAYTLLTRLPSEFLSDINVVASVFALQFDPLNKARIVGYGKDFLPATIDKIDCVVTDNRRFAIEGPLKLGLSESASKFQTVYNKSKLCEEISFEDSMALLGERTTFNCGQDRMKVVWAGRLDREKRIDLLIEVAQMTQSFCDFFVYGSAVVDGGYEAELERLSNVTLMGAYRSPCDWDLKFKGNTFLFTSVWEGMPNTVIEAAYLGFPIIASKVGGVGELITPNTGWGVDRYADATSYVRALSEIYNDSAEAKRRTKALIDMAHSRHNRQAYLTSLSAVPGYGKVK